MARIRIQGLQCMASIGVYAWEQKLKQKVILDLEFGIDLTQAANTDLIQDTIDYAKVCTLVRTWVASRHFNLLETLASEVKRLFEETFGISDLRLTVSKPHAIKDAGPVSVQLP